MKTILLANEIGQGFGHVKRLSTLAVKLHEMGWRTVMAPFRISSIDQDRYTFGDVIPAPGWPRLQQESWFESGVHKDTLINSYAGVAANVGIADPRVVTNIVKAWDSLFRLISPVAVIGDFAPGAMIAASGRIPSFAIGNGFTVPVIRDGYFALYQEKLAKDLALQDRVRTSVHEAMKRTGRDGLSDPLAAIRGDTPMPSCYREFDPCNKRRVEQVFPPRIALVEETPAPRLTDVGVYFGPNMRRHLRLLPLLGTLRPNPIITLEGAGTDIHETAQRAGLTVRATLFLPQDIQNCRVFIHHGGLGISQLCAATGVPQLAIFDDTEKWLTAEAIAARGAGIGIPLVMAEHARVEQALKTLLNDTKYKNAARAWREELKNERADEEYATTVCNRICAMTSTPREVSPAPPAASANRTYLTDKAY